MSALSDVLENRVIDNLLRGQASASPVNVFVALLTAAAGDAGGGTEVTGNGYARVSVPGTLAAWAGTQGAGTTLASTGTGGVTSNNAAVTFPTPTPSGWGVVTHWAVYEAATGGVLQFQAALAVSKTINAGDAVSFAAGSLTLTIG